VVEALKRALRLELAAEVEVARTGSAWLDVVAGQRISNDSSSSSSGIGSRARAKLSRNLKRARCVHLLSIMNSTVKKLLYACLCELSITDSITSEMLYACLYMRIVGHVVAAATVQGTHQYTDHAVLAYKVVRYTI
jgi:hypothetical protein